MSVVSTDEYIPEEYWEQRHQAFPGHYKAVAHMCIDESENTAQYRVKRRHIESVIERYVPKTAGRSLLDAGCGIGLLTPAYAAMGFEVTAVDLSPTAVEQARSTGVSASFHVGALSSIELDRKFDVICAIDVLLHIVDPAEWSATLAAFARHLAPGGILVILDWMAETPDLSTPAYCAARSLDAYATALAERGLRIDERVEFELEHEASIKTLLAVRHASQG